MLKSMSDHLKLGVSFSLFGESDHYLKGLIINSKLSKEIYPNSTLIVHTDKPEVVRSAIPDAEIVEYIEQGDLTGAFWRFLSYNDPRFDAVLFRDADSVVNVREAAAVSEWLESGLPIHAMLDHEAHTHGDWPVMAGMWGVRKGGLPFDFNYLVRWWLDNKKPFRYTSDQWFLRRYVWPLIASGDGLLHTRDLSVRWGGNAWPEHETYTSYVGARIPEP